MIRNPSLTQHTVVNYAVVICYADEDALIGWKV